ncbi:MAG: putative RNA uridine N3 methyltransferase [Thermoprotei archaeon]
MRLLVAVPTSILSVEQSLLFRTLKIFQITRFSSIFGVEELILYRDPYTAQEEHLEYKTLFEKIWKYLTTPPYLRKKLVPIDPDLKHVGVLPPLRLGVFEVSRDGFIGEKRIGVSSGKNLVDIGLDIKFLVVNPSACKSYRGFYYVEIESITPPRVRCLNEKPYIGPELVFKDNLIGAINYVRRLDCIVIATSRYGRIPSSESFHTLLSKPCIAILFGAPRYGLYDIARSEGYELENVVDYVWNTIPEQRVVTVRTEEALLATLAIINLYLRSGNS